MRPGRKGNRRRRRGCCAPAHGAAHSGLSNAGRFSCAVTLGRYEHSRLFKHPDSRRTDLYLCDFSHSQGNSQWTVGNDIAPLLGTNQGRYTRLIQRKRKADGTSEPNKDQCMPTSTRTPGCNDILLYSTQVYQNESAGRCELTATMPAA
jgi:hypothetical protein